MAGRMVSTPWARLDRVLSPHDSTGRKRLCQGTSGSIEVELILVDLRLRPALGAMLMCALVVLLSGCSSSNPAGDQAPSPDPMGGSNQSFDCNSDEYFVQVASETDVQAYIDRVAEVRSSGQLPPDTHYLTQDDDCGIFTTSRFWVLYVGPFATADAACPALLESPPDAAIKGLRKESRRANSPCLCAFDVDDIPIITEPNQTGQWVSEVQRSLLDVGYPITAEIRERPGQLSEVTSETVGKFQDAVGLSDTGLVDKATWERLQVVICG